MTLPENNTTILTSEYKLYLPTQSQLIKEINSVRQSFTKEMEDEQ